MHKPLTTALHRLLSARGPRLAAALTLTTGALISTAPGASATVYHAYAATTCANANTPTVTATPQTMRTAVLCLINHQRTSRHLPALHNQNRLDRSAQNWTDQMVNHRQFTHGNNFSARITAVGFDWSNAGENIASGYATPQAVVTAWMASTGHCQNILSPTYSDVGTGINNHAVQGSASGPATWTQDFGLPMGQPAPSTNTRPARGCPYTA
jgi:uncharacterized protein YkwD